MGNLYLLAASSKSGSSPLTLLLPFILIIAVFYFLLMRPQRNRQRKIQETQNAVGPGQRIRTTSGMYGTVVAIEDDDLILEIAPDVEVRVLKRAVMDVLPGNVNPDGADDADPDDDAEDAYADEAAPAADEDAAEDADAPADGVAADGTLADRAAADGSGDVESAGTGAGLADASADGAEDHSVPDGDRAAGRTRAREK